MAMQRAIDRILPSLTTKKFIIVIDGSYFIPQGNYEYICIPAADKHVPAVSAASILAKVYRDNLMKELSSSFPHYNFHINKGYYSEDHLQAIIKHGFSPLHRYFQIKKLREKPLF